MKQRLDSVDLDYLERYELLDAAIVLVEKADNPVIRHQMLGQALTLLSHETDEDAEIMSKRLLTAASTIRATPFESIVELAAWYQTKINETGWEALPISVVR